MRKKTTTKKSNVIEFPERPATQSPTLNLNDYDIEDEDDWELLDINELVTNGQPGYRALWLNNTLLIVDQNNTVAWSIVPGRVEQAA